MVRTDSNVIRVRNNFILIPPELLIFADSASKLQAAASSAIPDIFGKPRKNM